MELLISALYSPPNGSQTKQQNKGNKLKGMQSKDALSQNKRKRISYLRSPIFSRVLATEAEKDDKLPSVFGIRCHCRS